MEKYYFKQLDRDTGDFLGLVSYDSLYPTNDDPHILLEQMTEEEFYHEIEILMNNTEVETDE